MTWVSSLRTKKWLYEQSLILTTNNLYSIFNLGIVFSPNNAGNSPNQQILVYLELDRYYLVRTNLRTSIKL